MKKSVRITLDLSMFDVDHLQQALANYQRLADKHQKHLVASRMYQVERALSSQKHKFTDAV